MLALMMIPLCGFLFEAHTKEKESKNWDVCQRKAQLIRTTCHCMRPT